MFLSTTINGAQPRSRTMKKLCCEFLLILSLALPAATSPEYSIQAVRYGSAVHRFAALVMRHTTMAKLNLARLVGPIITLVTSSSAEASRTATTHNAQDVPL